MNTTLNTKSSAAAISNVAALIPVKVRTSVTVAYRSRRALALPAPSVRPVLAVREAVELTIGPDPQILVERCVNSIRNSSLRCFIGAVMAERDVNRVLTMLPGESVRFARWPIDRLRSCGESVSLRSSLLPVQREVLFVACLLAGIEVLIQPCVTYPSSTADVLRSIVRSALQRLDCDAPNLACALRNCMGWGNEDDMDGESIQALRQAVRTAAAQLRRSLV